MAERRHDRSHGARLRPAPARGGPVPEAHDAEETIELATLVATDDGSLVVRAPDGDETYTPTLDLHWMRRGTVLHGSEGETPPEPGADRGTRVDEGHDDPRDTSPQRPTATDRRARTRVDAAEGPQGDDAPAPTASAPEATGEPGRFELLGHVGKGAMGEVLLVRDRGLWRRVAFKRLLPELADNRGVVSRFFSEAQVTAQLDHPNIVPIYELEASPGHGLGYSMKLVCGETLTKLIARDREALADHGRRGEPKRLTRRLALFLDVCDAIAYAHKKRVLHRDLKPDNIMVGDLGEVYVMDWGIFRLLDGTGPDPDAVDDADDAVTTTGSHGRTQFGAIIGTPAWMSPEQAAGRIPDLGPASDQYALGLILYALVTLRSPRPRDALEVTLRRAREGELLPIAHDHGGGRIARELKAIIRRATARDPAARYPSVEALADDVRAFLRGDAVATRRDTPLQAFARLLAKHKFWAATAVMTLLVAGVTSAALLRIHADQRQEAIERYLQAVDHRVTDAEIALRGYEVGAVRLAGKVGVAMAGAPPSPPPRAWQSAEVDADLAPGLIPTACWSEPGAKEPVPLTLETPVIKLSPGTSPGRAADVMARIASLQPAFDELLRRPASPGDAASDAEVRTCETPARRTFATLARDGAGALGVHASFPGVGGYCASYDGLARPKYTAVRTVAQEVAWGESVYPDRYGAGLLTSVSAPVVNAQGEQIGVAGLELTLSWLVDELLEQPGAPHVREAFLTTASGRVIARQSGFDAEPLARLMADFDPCAESGKLRRAEDDLEPLPIPEAVARIAGGATEDQLRAEVYGEEALVVLRRISATGWYYVAVTDEDALP
ncbi:MAG: hypothetical protein EP329_15445 [Deltaproteobacteria bacterium]|nr:MAG: hypothetical protein EP329_15445 [Deltaproteobacteria bacterium]